MKPGLLVAVADLRVARAAPRAATAAADERHGDPVAGRQPRTAGADLHDHAGQLVAGHVREARCRGRGPSSRASRCGTARWP